MNIEESQCKMLRKVSARLFRWLAFGFFIRYSMEVFLVVCMASMSEAYYARMGKNTNVFSTASCLLVMAG